MSKYKVIFDGEEEDEVFETEKEAQLYALEICGAAREGAYLLNLSNPGDYDYDEENYEYPECEVIEVDD